MTEQNDGNATLVPEVAAHVGHIMRQFEQRYGTEGPEIEVVPEDGGVGFMHAPSQILVRDQHLDTVRAILGLSGEAGRHERLVRGAALLRLRQDDQHPTSHQALERIEAEIGQGIATPDHVLTVAPEAGPCPATEPREVYDKTEPFPGIRRANSGAGVSIYIADTGLLPHADRKCPWLHGVRGDEDPLPPREPDEVQKIPPYTGHGTFVAGVVRCMAPEAGIYVSNAFATAGSTLESDLVRKLTAALALPYDIFHLSITSSTRNNEALIGIESWLERLRQYKGTVCVVAAGNDGSSRRCWPAASPGTVSVGALGADWTSRARFSNYGSWVDVYAPGRDIVNAYATGTYKCYVPPYAGEKRRFHGMAQWSGTSFSAPVVSGLIADRMSRTGENGQRAADCLLEQARRQAIPGVGAVLLPGPGGGGSA